MTDNDDEFSAVILTFSGGPFGAKNQMKGGKNAFGKTK